MQRSPQVEDYPWFRQISDEDGSGCSVWQAFEPLQDGSKFNTDLEWVGDLNDLEHSGAHYCPLHSKSPACRMSDLSDTCNLDPA